MKRFLLSFSFLSLLPYVVLAQSGGGGGGTMLENPFKGGADSLGDFVQILANDVVMPLGAVVVVLYMIYSGFLFVVAQGNPAKLEEAKRAFLYSCIGAIVLLGAWTIAQVIQNTIDQITQ
ncbi:MAG: pilin [Patescibacteria group bacterium]|nr:pilin [bacterium]MDZ4240530.1 pilin [Patescibacteria group bacterium]